MFQLHLPFNKKAMGLPNKISAVAVLWVWDRREVGDWEISAHQEAEWQQVRQSDSDLLLLLFGKQDFLKNHFTTIYHRTSLFSETLFSR